MECSCGGVCKDWLKAVAVGAGLWLLMFAIASIVMFSIGTVWITPSMLVLGPILSATAAFYCLKGYCGQPCRCHDGCCCNLICRGALLGLVWLLMGAVLDCLVVVGLLKAGMAFYSLGLLAGYLEILLVPALVAWGIEGKKPAAKPVAARKPALKKKGRKR